MAIERSRRPMAAARVAASARELLDASTLCAIATVTRNGRAYVNTAYFACGRELEIVWLSHPQAMHSRNLRASETAAIAVYESSQTWGGFDRGIQLFGSARQAAGAHVARAERLYAERFPDARRTGRGAYRFYVFRPRRLKIFDERTLGGGTFVTANVDVKGRLEWERTEIYAPEADR